VDFERQIIFAQLAKTVRTNHRLLYGAGLLHASAFIVVKTMEFLSVRWKRGMWSGSHMVNTKANYRGYSLQNWWAHYKGCVLLLCVSLAFWSSRQRRQTGC